MTMNIRVKESILPFHVLARNLALLCRPKSRVFYEVCKKTLGFRQECIHAISCLLSRIIARQAHIFVAPEAASSLSHPLFWFTDASLNASARNYFGEEFSLLLVAMAKAGASGNDGGRLEL
jgi:hypothetical protein